MRAQWFSFVVIAVALLGLWCTPHTPRMMTPQQIDTAWPQETVQVEVVGPRSMYVLTVASQLMGTMVVDSVMNWSTVGGALRIDRWQKPGPLVVNGDYKIVDIQERH